MQIQLGSGRFERSQLDVAMHAFFRVVLRVITLVGLAFAAWVIWGYVAGSAAHADTQPSNGGQVSVANNNGNAESSQQANPLATVTSIVDGERSADLLGLGDARTVSLAQAIERGRFTQDTDVLLQPLGLPDALTPFTTTLQPIAETANGLFAPVANKLVSQSDLEQVLNPRTTPSVNPVENNRAESSHQAATPIASNALEGKASTIQFSNEAHPMVGKHAEPLHPVPVPVNFPVQSGAVSGGVGSGAGSPQGGTGALPSYYVSPEIANSEVMGTTEEPNFTANVLENPTFSPD